MRRQAAGGRLRLRKPVEDLLRVLHPSLKHKIRAACDQLIRNPYSGKGLRQDLSGLWSYRVGRFRIIYRIGPGREIEIIALGPRERIYEETYRLIRREGGAG